MIALALRLGWLVVPLSLASCNSQDSSVYASKQARYEAEMVQWIQDNSRKVNTGTLMLKDGSCLDLAKISAPWSLETDPAAAGNTNGLMIVADGGTAGFHPHIPAALANAEKNIWGDPLDGKIRVSVSGWSPPSPTWASYMVASPARIDENIHKGDFKRIDLWPGRDHGLEAYQGIGGRSYVDSRRLVQCRDYSKTRSLKDELVWCTAVNQREDFQVGLRFDSRDIPALPESLRKLEQAIEATRTACPPAASSGPKPTAPASTGA